MQCFQKSSAADALKCTYFQHYERKTIWKCLDVIVFRLFLYLVATEMECWCTGSDIVSCHVWNDAVCIRPGEMIISERYTDLFKPCLIINHFHKARVLSEHNTALLKPCLIINHFHKARVRKKHGLCSRTQRIVIVIVYVKISVFIHAFHFKFTMVCRRLVNVSVTNWRTVQFYIKLRECRFDECGK